ncbi:MAG: S-layer homology domain-containing protein [Thermoanaerobaculia bacterium]
MMRRAMLVAGWFLLGVPLLFGQAPIEERIPITDPDRLESLGLPRDATNVYEWSKAAAAAPATATFDDVPTSHPLFQYVEALVKAGVTGGCGAGNFCPTAPLTRGQMAVFLSRALGLQWP